MNCICCGKKLGIMSGSSRLSFEYSEAICEKCYGKFRNEINEYNDMQNPDNKNKKAEELIQTIKRCDFTAKGTEYVIDYINNTKNQVIKKYIDFSKQELSEKTKNYIITSGYDINNYEISNYLGIISGSVVLGTGLLSEFESSISDFLGTQSEEFSNKLEKARKAALSKLIDDAANYIECNAIIGVDFDYITFSNNKIGVIANGTAVVAKRSITNNSI